jgi:hypothetical protein
MAYIYPENQKLLWNTIQKTPIFNSLGYQQSQWFKSIIQRFYEEYPNAKVIKTKDELQNINRATITYMVNSLKEMVQPKQIMQTSAVSLPSTTGSNERMSYYNDQFNNRQKEYESMNTKPLPPRNSVVDEKITDEVITNMDELIRQQIEQRELELKMFGQAPLSQMPKITINEEIHTVEHLVISKDDENNENKERIKKNVSWKNVEPEEFEELKKKVLELVDIVENMKQRLDEFTAVKSDTQ